MNSELSILLETAQYDRSNQADLSGGCLPSSIRDMVKLIEQVWVIHLGLLGTEERGATG